MCLCNGSDRSLVANIGAALSCEKSHIQQSIEKLTQYPEYYYIEGFFIPNKMDICRYLHQKFSEYPDILFITNLNAPYIVNTFSKDVTWMVNKADVVFGNRDEFEELSTINGYRSMDDMIAELVSAYSKSHRPKIIVITDGSSPIVVYEGNKNGLDSWSVEVPRVDNDKIIDTTGAGDSFVAGFLYALMKGESVKSSVQFGCKIAGHVIQTIGCNLPKGIEI